MRPQLHSEECGMWGILWGRGTHSQMREPDLETWNWSRHRACCQDGKYFVGVSTFCFLSLAARRAASARMGWDECMRVKSCVQMNICIKSCSLAPSLSCPYKCSGPRMSAAAVRKEIFLVTNGLHTDFQPGPLRALRAGRGWPHCRLGGSEVQKPVSNISAPSSLAPTRCCIFRES